METDPHGNPVPKYRTEVRTGWTAQNLYFLFVCPYEQLNLRPNPKTSTETYGLWNWDVAEVFIGADFKDVKPYKEFEISPRENGQTWILISINRITRKVDLEFRLPGFGTNRPCCSPLVRRSEDSI